MGPDKGVTLMQGLASAHLQQHLFQLHLEEVASQGGAGEGIPEDLSVLQLLMDPGVKVVHALESGWTVQHIPREGPGET